MRGREEDRGFGDDGEEKREGGGRTLRTLTVGTGPYCLRCSCHNLILLGLPFPTAGKLEVSGMVRA